MDLVRFENNEYELYQEGHKIMMSMEELAKAIDYSELRAFKTFLSENDYLLSPEFSLLLTVDNLEGGIIKKRQKRFFTEQGIYEVSLLANTKKAKEFRKFARTLITKYRKGEIKISDSVSQMKLEVLENKLDEMIEVVKNTEKIVSDSEEAETSFKEAIKRVEEKLNKLDTIEQDVKLLKELYNKAVEVVNEHEGRLLELEEQE